MRGMRWFREMYSIPKIKNVSELLSSDTLFTKILFQAGS
jgi:hypothetical protein